MATLELRYGGVTFATAEVLIRRRGYYLEAMLNQSGVSGQVGHMWMMAGPSGQVNSVPNPSFVDSSQDQELEIVLIPESEEEFTRFDFLTLRSLTVELLKSVGIGANINANAIANLEFQVPSPNAIIAKIELETPFSVGYIANLLLEAPSTTGTIAMIEVEAPQMAGLIAQIEFEVPGGGLELEGGGVLELEDQGFLDLEE